MKILLLTIILFYILISIYYSRFVINSVLDRKRKIINIIFVWIIPFFWGILLKTVLKPISEKDKKIDRFHFNESGIGDNV